MATTIRVGGWDQRLRATARRADVAARFVSPYLRGCLQAPMNGRRQFHDARVFDSAMNELTFQLGCEVVVEVVQANEPESSPSVSAVDCTRPGGATTNAVPCTSCDS